MQSIFTSHILNNAKGNTMFTTVITNTVPKTIDVAVGDVFTYSAATQYPVAYVVTAVDPAAAKPLTVKRLTGFGKAGVETTTTLDGMSEYTHLRPEGAEATTVDVEEVVATIEHKFQVGDVIQYAGKHAFNRQPQTITSIGFRPSGACTDEPFYFYDGDTEGGDRVANVDNESYYGAVLVGGPRFVEAPPEGTKFQVGDIVDTERLGKGREITAIAKSPMGTWQYVHAGGKDSVKNVDAGHYGYVLVGGPRFEAARAAKVTALQTLQKARDLISTPDTWTKNTFHHNGRFCALGAINTAAGSTNGDNSRVPFENRGVVVEARTAVEQVVGNNIWMWNDKDDTTHAKVMAAFDKAIADLRFAEVVGA